MGADADDETFETTDAGASHTFPFQAGDLKKGSHMMIKGNPCKVAEISMSKTGKKYEDLCPSSHNVECPFVKRTEYTFLDADHDSGEVTLLKENGDMKQDLNLPDRVLVGEATEDDKKLTMDIKSAQEAGKEMSVVVLEACGKEKIIQLKEKEGGS